jgi:hypothetical protein
MGSEGKELAAVRAELFWRGEEERKVGERTRRHVGLLGQGKKGAHGRERGRRRVGPKRSVWGEHARASSWLKARGD